MSKLGKIWSTQLLNDPTVKIEMCVFFLIQYDTALAPRWYQEAWQRANCEDEENESDELN